MNINLFKESSLAWVVKYKTSFTQEKFRTQANEKLQIFDPMDGVAYATPMRIENLFI